MSALIAASFFLFFSIFVFVFFGSCLSLSSHILFSLLLDIFFLYFPSFCTFKHNQSPSCLKKFVQQYASAGYAYTLDGTALSWVSKLRKIVAFYYVAVTEAT